MMVMMMLKNDNERFMMINDDSLTLIWNVHDTGDEDGEDDETGHNDI